MVNEELEQLKSKIDDLNKRIIRLEKKETNRKVFTIIKIFLFVVVLFATLGFLYLFKMNIDEILGMIER